MSDCLLALGGVAALGLYVFVATLLLRVSLKEHDRAKARNRYESDFQGRHDCGCSDRYHYGCAEATWKRFLAVCWLPASLLSLAALPAVGTAALAYCGGRGLANRLSRDSQRTIDRAERIRALEHELELDR